VGRCGHGDFFLAVRAASDEVATRALAVGKDAAFAGGQGREENHERTARPRSVADAASRVGGNLAVVSVPGEYAALAAYQALTARMHVLLFSDNVPIEKEVALKRYAGDRGLLVMGPGAGTSVIGGVGLGFANAVEPGRVGVVAAAGTGAQEVMCLLDRWGAGVSQVLGLGGRDLSARVDGATARSAVAALVADPATELILLVSKPPDREVVAQVLALVQGLPTVATLLGETAGDLTLPGVELADTLEGGALATLRLLGLPTPDPTVVVGPSVREVRERLNPARTLVRGLFSGGSLCYESLVVLRKELGEVRSNTPIVPDWGLPAPPESHQCLDLGEEEYTRGRPHPMIDPEGRVELLRQHGADPYVAAIILDIVLGFGAHRDPAGVLAPECASVMAGDGPQVVVHVLGTDHDPQSLRDQREAFARAGCIVAETAAQAARTAAAIAESGTKAGRDGA
jgi:FdrA protein